MASQMIGRTECPECGFKSAHVKQSEKCLHRYCPECNSQYFAKTPRQQDELKKKTRMSEVEFKSPTPAATASATATPPEPPASATATDSEPAATASEASATAPKRRGLFS